MLRRRLAGRAGAFADVCGPHGLFLERGALEAIVAASASLPPSAPPLDLVETYSPSRQPRDLVDEGGTWTLAFAELVLVVVASILE